MARPKLYMLVGVPCSGKSTWTDQYVSFVGGFDLYIASTDAYIESYAKSVGKTYNEVFQDKIKEAEKDMYVNVGLATDAGRDIIWDQTNLTRKSRAKKLIMIPDWYEKFSIEFFTPPEEELKRRLNSRPGKTIPDHVMKSMIASYEPVAEDEGFDKRIWTNELTTSENPYEALG